LRVQQIAIRNVGWRPRAELLRQNVKDDLIGDEEEHQGETQRRAEEEGLRPQVPPAQEIGDRNLVSIALAIERLGPRRDQKNRYAIAQGCEQRAKELAGQKAAIRFGGLVTILRPRERIEAGEKDEDESDPAKNPRSLPLHIAVADFGDDHDEQAEEEKHDGKSVNDRGGVIQRPEFLIISDPLIGNFQVLFVQSD